MHGSNSSKLLSLKCTEVLFYHVCFTIKLVKLILMSVYVWKIIYSHVYIYIYICTMTLNCDILYISHVCKHIHVYKVCIEFQTKTFSKDETQII